MANIVENRTVVCKYVDERKTIDEYTQFGWILTNKILLNRFGNPLSTNERVSNDDLEEKCSYQLYFTRGIDDSVAMEVNRLQAKYNDIPLLDNSFGGGRVTGCVFLTLALLTFLILSISGFQRVISVSVGIMSLILFFLAAAGITAIIWGGVVSVINANKKNADIQKQKDEIVAEAKRLLTL